MWKKKQKESLIIKKWLKIWIIGWIIISIPLFLELIQNWLSNWVFSSKWSNYNSYTPPSFTVFWRLIKLLFFWIIIGLVWYFWLLAKIFDKPKRKKKNNT